MMLQVQRKRGPLTSFQQGPESVVTALTKMGAKNVKMQRLFTAFSVNLQVLSYQRGT